MRLGPENVGRRVVLRHRLPDGRATDVLGELLAWDIDGGFARVGTVRGEVTVPLADIIMGKPVPPAPSPRHRRPTARGGSGLSAPVTTGATGVVELHDLMADGWLPLERADYGGWRLRAAEGFTGRANSVLPLGAPPEALAAAVDHVEGWYADRSLPGRFCVPWPLGAGPGDPAYGDDPLEQELVRRGYTLDTPTLVMTAPLAELGAAVSPSAVPPGLRWDVRTDPDEAWLALYHYRGQELPPVAVRVLTSAPDRAFGSLRAGGGAGDPERAVAVGRVALSRGWAGITAVEVAPDHRRQGLGTQVLAGLLRWAGRQDAHASYLQVARANAPAVALYERLGYRPHSGYHYRIQA